MTTLTTVVLQSGVTAADLALAPAITVRPVEGRPTDGRVGVIVEGIDLADRLSGDEIRSLLTIWNNAGLMILRDQHRLTPERQVEVVEWFGRRFARGAGPEAIDQLPMVGELPVQLLSNRDRRRPGKEVITGPKMAAATQELKMHSDVQDYASPPDLTTLHGIEIPPPEAGGQTFFWDLFAAYDALDDELKARLGTLRWRPTSTYATMKGVKQPQALANEAPDSESPVSHPVVRTHPHSGRRALWVSTFTKQIVGLEPDEDAALRRQLIRHVAQERFCYTHTWQPHDVLFWDNRSVNHARSSWDGRYLREMHRAQAGGSTPF